MTTIRSATLDDLPGIFAIYDPEVLSGMATFETVARTPAQRLDWFNAHATARHPIVVAADGPAILGWASGSRWSPRPAYDRAVETSVYIAAGQRGKGLGRSLMQDLIGRTQQAGAGVLIARIVEGNPASLALHESLGFQTVGITRRIGEKFGRLLDVRIMDLHLD
jgi:L-amino acid N-acyltransferase